MLDHLQRPAHFTYEGRPIVLPSGVLLVEHLAHQPTTTAVDVGEDGMLDDVPSGPSRIPPQFDLTAGR